MVFQILKDKVLQCKTPLVSGIDPHISTRKSITWVKSDRDYLWEFSKRVLRASRGVSAVKIQSAFFEAFNEAALLPDIVKLAHDHGNMVILDAKRGDIGSTMYAYGYSAFETIGADILTVSPFMGVETLTELDEWTADHQKGLFLLMQTSNCEDPILQNAHHIFQTFKKQPSLGFVIGLNRLDSFDLHLRNELVKSFPILLPGLGAQNAHSHNLSHFLSYQHLRSHNTCGLFPVSRDLYPKGWTDWDTFENHVRTKLTQWSKVLQICNTL